MKPTVGRIVHYYDAALGPRYLAALITRVYDADERPLGSPLGVIAVEGAVNLCVFLAQSESAAGGDTLHVVCAPFDDSEPRKSGYWRWPPRDPA